MLSAKELTISYLKGLLSQGKITQYDGGQNGFYASYETKIDGGEIQYTTEYFEEEYEAFVALIKMVPAIDVEAA